MISGNIVLLVVIINLIDPLLLPANKIIECFKIYSIFNCEDMCVIVCGYMYMSAGDCRVSKKKKRVVTAICNRMHEGAPPSTSSLFSEFFIATMPV